MTRLTILSSDKQLEFDAPSKLNVKKRALFFSLDNNTLEFVKALRTATTQVGSKCRNDRKVPEMFINPYFSRVLEPTQTIFTILAIRSFLKFLRQFFQQFQTRNIDFY